MYNASIDYAYWKDGSASRLAYGYNGGVWEDYYSASWHNLSNSGISPAFIGDGAYHLVWSDGAKYQYIASTDLGYWSSTGVTNDNDFRLSYGTGQWFRYSDSSTIYNVVEYKGNRRYLLTDYMYWTSAGLKSTTYTGSDYGTDVQNVLWFDTTNKALATWYIFKPVGTNLKWNGGALDVEVVNIHSQADNGQPDWPYWFKMFEQYTKENVITIEYDLEQGTSLSTVLDGLNYITDTYGKTIDDLAVLSHGSTDGFGFGDWIATWNYTTFASQWTRLNGLMTNGGQIQLYHCLAGAASSMLDDIASRTNTHIFANIDPQWYRWSFGPNGNTENSNAWNNNYKDPWLGGLAREAGGDLRMPKVNFIDLDFEYQSDKSGKRGYKMLFTPSSPAGYSQADMVYWWNNDHGIP